MFRMEAEKFLTHTQFLLPVSCVILAVLVFVFGFKTVAEPKFSDRLSPEERKAKKQAKSKEKKKSLSNGVANANAKQREKRSSEEERSSGGSPAKAAKKETVKKPVEKKPAATAVEPTKPAPKNKEPKAPKTKKQVIPEDFDDGEWVQAINRKERKQRKIEPSTGETVTKKNTKAAKDSKKGEKNKPEGQTVSKDNENRTHKSPKQQPASVPETKENKPSEQLTNQVESGQEVKAVHDVNKNQVEANNNSQLQPKTESETEKPPKQIEETNNNENNTPVADIVDKEKGKDERGEEVAESSAVKEPVQTEDTWQEIQVSKKKKKARRD